MSRPTSETTCSLEMAPSETTIAELLEEGIRSAQEFFVLLSPRLDILYKNDFAKRFLGRQGSANVPTDILSLFEPEERERFAQDVFPRVLSGHTWEGEVTLFPSQAQSPKVFHWEIRPLFGRNDRNTVEALSILGRNITDVRRLLARSKRMALSLEHERRSLRTLFDQAPIGIAVLDGPNHVYSYVNPAYLTFLPKSADEIVGKPLLEAFPEMRGQGFDALLDGVFHTGKSFSGRDLPADLKNPDGSARRIYVDVVYHARYDIGGKVDGIIAVGSDVTGRHEAQRLAEQKAAEFSTLAELSPQILFTLDASGKVTYFNGKWYEYTGFSRDDAHDWRDALLPISRAAVWESLRVKIQSPQPVEIEFALRRFDGVYRWHVCHAHPVRASADEGVLKWIGVMTDVDDFKKIAEELQGARLTAENANAMKSAFLSNVSHELRTPLTAILGSAQLGLRECFGHPKASARFATILRTGQHMLSLVEDILDISKVEAGKLRMDPCAFSLPDLLVEVKEALLPRAQSKGLELGFEHEGRLPTCVVTDPTRLRQVLLNLLGNALKFTERGKVVCRVAQDPGQREGDPLWIRFEVEDSGCGIAPHLVPNLFVPFMQSDVSVTRVHGGSGLGLAISRKIARAMGGDVTLLRTEVGKGSTFDFTFPAQFCEDKSN